MKKILSALGMMLFSHLSSFAQDTFVYPMGDTVTVSEPKVKKPAKNFLKVNLLNLAIRNYSFQYERVLSKRFSLALGYRFMPIGGIPLLSSIEKMADITDKDVLDAIRKVQVKDMAITPELRFYVGKRGYGRGFYLAPFYRYSVFETGSLPVKVDNNTKTINLSGKLTTNTVGLQLGAQWMLSKRISLDWWILGPQFGTHKSEFIGSQEDDFKPNEEKDIKDFFNSISFPNLNFVPTVNKKSVSVSTSGPWAGIRTGLCLGIRF